MENKEIRILGVKVTNRNQEAETVQRILTRFGCCIKMRLGLHENAKNPCTPYGLILLELYGNPQDMENLEKELNALEGIETKKMSFMFED